MEIISETMKKQLFGQVSELLSKYNPADLVDITEAIETDINTTTFEIELNYFKEKKDALFKIIKEWCSQHITQGWIATNRTSNGNTQNSERPIIQKFKEMLNELHLTFEEAGSQQPKDFRNVGGIGLDIEIKKADKNTIKFNDTCPSDDIYYIILYTGKINKRQSVKNKNIPPQILYLNGSEFLKDRERLDAYNKDITALKDKYCRGDNKQMLTSTMTAYVRPNLDASISGFLCSEI
jgi:hypothetical protein